jgi:hypothetical protein
MSDLIDDRDDHQALGLDLSSGRLNRRWFLGGSALAIGGVVLAACGDDDEGNNGASGSDDTTDDSTGGGGGGGGGDIAIAIAQGAAGLEVLAVNTYTAAAEAAEAGDLGEVPPAVGEFVGTALEQHQAALDAWNEVLVGAGEDEVTMPPSDLESTVNDMFAEVTDVAGAAELALTLETIASQTYLDAQPMLTDPAAIELAGSIQVVDQQHIAVLLFVSGEYPVPDTFQSTQESVLA